MKQCARRKVNYLRPALRNFKASSSSSLRESPVSMAENDSSCLAGRDFFFVLPPCFFNLRLDLGGNTNNTIQQSGKGGERVGHCGTSTSTYLIAGPFPSALYSDSLSEFSFSP